MEATATATLGQRLSPKAVADLWGVDSDTVLRLLRSGKLAGFKIGRSWRVPVEAVKAFEEAAGNKKPTPPLPKRRIVTRIS